MSHDTAGTVAQAVREHGERVFRILAIDGGGMRGLIPAQVLSYVERRAGKPVHELFDLVAGTSTGGILGLALATPRPGAAEPYGAEAASDLYVADRKEIFARGPWHAVVESGGGWWGPKYPADGIDDALRRRFGDRTLGDARTNVLVTSYDTEAAAPYFFKSWRTRLPLSDPDSQDDFPSWQVARATSAAPTYFPPLRLPPLRRTKDAARTLVDGAVFANDPAICAYAEAVRLMRGEPAARIVVVSLGTGDFFRPEHFRTLEHAGRLGWILPLLRIVMDGVSDAAQYQCEQLVADSCVRFQAEGVRRELDDTSDAAVAELIAAGRGIVEARRRDLDELAEALAAAPRWRPAGAGRPGAPVAMAGATTADRERDPGRNAHE